MTINVSSRKLLEGTKLLLLLIITGLLVWSQPWDSSSSSSATKKITVTGETTIEASPDEFTFYPYYEKTGTDRDALRDELVPDANQIIDGLRQLGVPDEDMKIDASSYDRWYWGDDEEGVLTVSIAITSKDDDLVQEIQDYLLTTDAKGQLTPQANFSDERRKELDKQAVEEASQDAREKAEAQATLFGAKLGDVIEVNQGRDSLFVDYGVAELDIQASSREANLPVLPGQSDYMQSVVVTYELR